VYRCVTQQRWGTYLAGRRKARQALGAGNLDGGGPQGMREGPMVLLAGSCGALVGRWVSYPVGEALCGGQGCGTFERPSLTRESSSGGAA
jgi:hypothetical protein